MAHGVSGWDSGSLDLKCRPRPPASSGVSPAGTQRKYETRSRIENITDELGMVLFSGLAIPCMKVLGIPT